MSVLGKDLFDFQRSHTNTKVEFGASGYWVEMVPEMQPYGTVLTEILNLDVTPFQKLLDRLNTAVHEKNYDDAPRAYMDMQKGFGSLPLYRLYLMDFRYFGDMKIEEFVGEEAREAFAEYVINEEREIPSFMQQQIKDIQLIQERYAWFLDRVFANAVFEKKKGQRKESLAQLIYSSGYEAFVSGVSLGKDPEVDAPLVRAQYRIRGERENAEVVEKMYFDRLLDFVYVELMKGLQKGFVPKRCANCGRWFLQMPGMTYAYCGEPAPGQDGKTCREIGATSSFRSKVQNNDVWKAHQRAYKKYFARTRKGTMSKGVFEVWSRKMETLRDDALKEYDRAKSEEERQRIVDEVTQKLNTLERIEAEDGGSYHPDQAGTYIATYWVVPKDARDSYSVSRKIILTDTEGQAHTEENGGQKQKEDTNSEEDSETPVQGILDVEVTVSGEDADAQAARELEEKIEDGEVMMLSGAENTFRARETVHLEKGETIYYPSYIGNYLTCWFTVNGKIAYCLESHRSSPPRGDYVAQVLDSNKNLQKVLYYGYGGAGDITGSYLSGKSAEEKYVYTHIAASYAYAGEAGFTGCKYEDLVNAGVIAYIDHLFAMEEPPKGEISLSKTSVKAVRNGNVQKTPDIF